MRAVEGPQPQRFNQWLTGKPDDEVTGRDDDSSERDRLVQSARPVLVGTRRCDTACEYGQTQLGQGVGIAHGTVDDEAGDAERFGANTDEIADEGACVVT